MSEISAATGEQAGGIDEMSQAVAHMDEMTQQNAAMAEQSAAAATELSSQVQRLREQVDWFRTGGSRATAAPAPTSEPDRLRKLAAGAFKAPARPAARHASASAPARKVANGGNWDEF